MSKYQQMSYSLANAEDDDGFSAFMSHNLYKNNNENIYENDTKANANNYMQTMRSSTGSFHDVNSPNFAPNAEFDDNTMEVPLLNNRSRHQSHGDDSLDCHYNQLGFGANLTSKSTRDARCRILLAIALCCVFMFVEFLGGYLAGSLAIMSDAAHLATDCISFVIGLVAIWIGSRPPDAKMSFGYKRIEVMGAIVSILGIWMLTATLLAVAVNRIFAGDYDLDANTMMTVSAIGILINIAMAFILHGSSSLLPNGLTAHSHSHSHSHSHAHAHAHAHSHSHADVHLQQLQQHIVTGQSCATLGAQSSAAIETTSPPQTDFTLLPDVGGSLTLAIGNGLKHAKNCDFDNAAEEKNVNLRAAMIHVIGDLVQSLGVFLAAVLIKFFPKAKVVDPLCTIFFAAIVILTTVRLFKESVNILMDAVPHGLSPEALELDLYRIESVKSVHHLNIWQHTSDFRVLMAHLVIDANADVNRVLKEATQLASSKKYNIKHATIQIEPLIAA